MPPPTGMRMTTLSSLLSLILAVTRQTGWGGVGWSGKGACARNAGNGVSLLQDPPDTHQPTGLCHASQVGKQAGVLQSKQFGGLSLDVIVDGPFAAHVELAPGTTGSVTNNPARRCEAMAAATHPAIDARRPQVLLYQPLHDDFVPIVATQRRIAAG